jgi:glycosyltransferase involved in cell wall biosynthesis
MIARQCEWPWLDDSVPVVVFVGRLSPVKRVDLLLAAYRDIRRKMPVRLLIVGSGPLQGWVEHQAVQYGFQRDCALTGFVENVLPLIRRSQVLVLPSDYEGFGNVLVEAMACGTQIVATDCPHGPSEILDNGTYGQLVPTGDVVALEEAIRSVLEHRFVVPAETLRDRAQAFTLDKAVDAYLEVVRSEF